MTTVSAPVQWVAVFALDGVGSLWHAYINLIDVQADNDRLREDNAALARELGVREEQRQENGRLRALLGLARTAPAVRMLHARVIAASPTPLFRSLRLDRGERDGVRVGAAVLGAEGVMGRVATVTASWADVMLLVDANSSTDVLIQRTRARARVRGTGSDASFGLQAEYLTRGADVEPGDVLITSGAGTVFPKGLRVGTVVTVERGAFGLYQSASVVPSVDFSRAEDVLVVVESFPAGTTFERELDVSDTLGPLREVETAAHGDEAP